jgi:hypothetical protein
LVYFSLFSARCKGSAKPSPSKEVIVNLEYPYAPRARSIMRAGVFGVWPGVPRANWGQMKIGKCLGMKRRKCVERRLRAIASN